MMDGTAITSPMRPQALTQQHPRLPLRLITVNWRCLARHIHYVLYCEQAYLSSKEVITML
jgi:hypothetical protein